jgi:hypothetical protein
MPFRFLDLPAELRNYVHEYVSYKDQPTAINYTAGRQNGTYPGLSTASREIRAEYCLIQRREANIIVRWSDLLTYLATFYPYDVVAGPQKLTVALDLALRLKAHHTVEMDLLPLLQLRSRSPSTHVQFTMDRSFGVNMTSEDSSTEIECRGLGQIMNHEDSKWLRDIQAGAFERVPVQRNRSDFIDVHIKYKLLRRPKDIILSDRWGQDRSYGLQAFFEKDGNEVFVVFLE